MATLCISLPDRMPEWIETRVQRGDHTSASDYVCDLIRRDQERSEKITAMQRLVDEGLGSGIGNRSKDELFAMAIRKADARAKLDD
jgi:antitoxin ParD1/3/4